LPLANFCVLRFSSRSSPAGGGAACSCGCTDARYAEVDIERRDGEHCKRDIERRGTDIALGVDVERCQYTENAENHNGGNWNGPATPDTKRALCCWLAAAQLNDAEPCNRVKKCFKNRANQEQYCERVSEKDDAGNGRR